MRWRSARLGDFLVMAGLVPAIHAPMKRAVESLFGVEEDGALLRRVSLALRTIQSPSLAT